MRSPSDYLVLDCILVWIFVAWHLLLGSLPIIFIATDIGRALKKRIHWIPPISLVLSSFSLQLLMILNNSPGFARNLDDDLVTEWYVSPNGIRISYSDIEVCATYQDYFATWILTLAGRVSVCVFMGCLLPAVANPLSPNMWTDMAALIVSTSVSVLQIAYDIYYLLRLRDQNVAKCVTMSFDGEWWDSLYIFGCVWENVAILVSMIVLIVLLCCSAVASVGIHQIVCRKIAIFLSPQKLNHQFSWKNVEEHLTNSVFVVHSFSPQYIIARSVITSPIALITVICNGILIHESLYGMHLNNYIEIPLVFALIMLGSGVIFWRCITAPIYYPKKISWEWSSIKQYFKIENFWLSYLEELQSRSVEEMGRSRFKKLLNKLLGSTVLPVLFWMQTFSVVISKTCWLVLQVLLSNKFMKKLFMRSASQEFSYINGEKDQLVIILGKGKTSEFEKDSKALPHLPGECPAGIWIANKKSIEYIKKQMEKGEQEERKCKELMWLLEHISSDFKGWKHAKPHQHYPVISLEVERDLDLCKPSFKMAVVSIVTLMAELATFVPDHNNLINTITEACSQAWNIIDIVEDSKSDAATLSKCADKIFQDLQKSRTWLGYHLPLSKCDGNSVEAAKTSIQNVVNKAQQMAMDYQSRKWEEVAAGYRLFSLSLSLNYQECTTVEEIVVKMCNMLADIVASCTVKAVGVVVTDCKKWAALYEEENILKAAQVAGKVKHLMENVGWQLKWSFSSETLSVETWVDRAANGQLLRKYATFQNQSDVMKEE